MYSCPGWFSNQTTHEFYFLKLLLIGRVKKHKNQSGRFFVWMLFYLHFMSFCCDQMPVPFLQNGKKKKEKNDSFFPHETEGTEVGFSRQSLVYTCAPSSHFTCVHSDDLHSLLSSRFPPHMVPPHHSLHTTGIPHPAIVTPNVKQESSHSDISSLNSSWVDRQPPWKKN